MMFLAPIWQTSEKNKDVSSKLVISNFKGAGYSDYSCQSKEKLSANNTSTNTRKLKLGTELRYY